MMKAMKGMWPLLPEVRLYHDADNALRHMRRRGINPEEVLDGPYAQTWVSSEGAFVLMSYEGDHMEELALLVHEAVHVVRKYFSEVLMEEDAGEEIYAYATQKVAYALMKAHERWRKKRHH